MEVISFRYYAPNGDSTRKIEPYFLIFKWSSWYVWGFCKLRKDYRMFKLNRMDEITKTMKLDGFGIMKKVKKNKRRTNDGKDNREQKFLL